MNNVSQKIKIPDQRVKDFGVVHTTDDLVKKR